MSKVSTITVEGFAATTPEVRTVGNNKRVADVVVYHTRRRKTDAGQWEDAGPSTVYVASMWDEQADVAATTINKGAPIIMWGTPEAEAYLKSDGTAQAKVKLLGATVAPLVGGKQAAQGAAQQPYASTPAPAYPQPVQAATAAPDVWGAPGADYPDSPF